MPRTARMMAIAIATSCLFWSTTTKVSAQQDATSAPVKVDRTVSSIELITKTSRLLEFDYDVPELLVGTFFDYSTAAPDANANEYNNGLHRDWTDCLHVY